MSISDRTLDLLGDKEIEVLELLHEAYAGDKRAQLRLKYEALSTSDFPGIFARVTQAALEDAYTEAPAPLWPKISRRQVNDSLRPQEWKSLDINLMNLPEDGGGYRRVPTTLPHVPELSQYPTIGFSAGERNLQLGKFGARIPFSWEAWEHDEWGMIQRMPGELGIAGVRTEDAETFGMIYSATGWNTTFITPAMHVTGDPKLSLQSLQAAIELASQGFDATEATGYRLNTVTQWVLLVPTNLVPLANTILAAQQIKVTDANGTEYLTGNTVNGSIKEVVAVPYIPIFVGSGVAYRNSMWALVPADGAGSDRPTFLTLFLRGQEVPTFRIKNDQGFALGGGSIDPYAGSFDNDSIQIRVRHFTGAAAVDLTGVVVSNGTGT